MDGKVIIGTEIDTSGVDKGLNEIDKKVKMKDFTDKISKGLSKISDVVKGIFSAIGSVVGTILTIAKTLVSVIARLIIATTVIAGIIGAIVLVGVIIIKAFSKVAEEHQEIISNIKYLIFIISQALAPAVNSVANVIASSINWILNLLAKVLTYIAYIIKAWFGINILAGASKDAFMQSQEATGGMANNLGKASKNAKDLKKQLAGFDEMNVLQDNTSESAGAGGGGIGGGGGAGLVAPTLELGGEVPEWIKWIAENKDLVISALLGIAGAILVVKLGLTGLLGGVIIGLIIALVALIIQNWDKVMAVLSVVAQWIWEHVIQPVIDFFVALWNKIVEILTPIISFIAGIVSTILENIKITINNIITIIKFLWDTIVGVLKPIFTWIWDNILKPVFNIVGEIIDGIKNKISGIVDFIKNIISIIWNLITSVASTVGNVIGSVFKSVINGVLGAIEGVLNTPIKAINKLIDIVRVVPGLSGLKSLKTFNLPRLAKGGIINLPGRGLPVALGGERGAEGVIPLTDSQQMALLGEAIGKYININATVPVYVGNRQIAREIRKINAEDDFAFNG